MILTDLLGTEVHVPLEPTDPGWVSTATGSARDDQPPTSRIGWVSDVRLLLDEPAGDQAMPKARLYGLIVSPHARSSSLGFERLDIRSPWPIARFEHWLHRESFLVRWPDIAGIADGRVRLRPGFTRYAPQLVTSAATRRVDRSGA